jgi:hypothetical protein
MDEFFASKPATNDSYLCVGLSQNQRPQTWLMPELVAGWDTTCRCPKLIVSVGLLRFWAALAARTLPAAFVTSLASELIRRPNQGFPAPRLLRTSAAPLFPTSVAGFENRSGLICLR